MKIRSLLLLGMVCMAFCALSQKTRIAASSLVREKIFQNVPFMELSAGTATQVDAEKRKRVENAVARYQLFSLNKQAVQNMQASAQAPVEMKMPMDDGTQADLMLVPVNIYTEDFSVVTQNGPVQVNQGLHYRGIVKGNENSLVAISVFDNEMMGYISVAGKGNYVIGKLQGEKSAENPHLVYNDKNLKSLPDVSCATKDDVVTQSPITALGNNMVALTNRCVRLYYETEYDIYQNKGSEQAVINYMTGLHNQVATLYSNDGISTGLSQIFVWTTTDPYTGSGTSSNLSQFQNTRTSFNGDLGQLLTFRSLGGGVAATINGLCGSVSNRLCTSGINSTYSDVPTYSWTTMVTTHEFGHLFGSRHTHACVWNGNNTAIDGCSGQTEGGCPLPGNPAGGGTIMSYCHTTNAGINFNNGFGPQPAQAIRNAVEASACLGVNCGGAAACGAPTGLTSSNVTSTSATVSWTAVTSAVSYDVDFKLSSASAWTNVATATTALSQNLTGLSAGSTYNWRVKTNCASQSSGYSSAQVVTLGGGCVNAYEANESLAAAASIANNTTVSAAISSSTDKDWYKITLTASSNLNITLTNLPDDYDIVLYSASGTEITRSEMSGTSNESIVRTGVAAGTYYLQVFGYDGVFSTSTCYNLNAGVTTSTGCSSSYDNVDNSSPSVAPAIPLNTDVKGRISPSGDNDYYKFVITNGGTISIALSTLPADYDLRLYNASGTAVAISQAGGTSSELINYNATAGTYYVRVYGYGGANSSTVCYTLKVATGTASLPSENMITGSNVFKASLYPNPAKQAIQLSVVSDRTSILTTRIYDVNGRMLMSQPAKDGNNSFDIQRLSPGVYFLKLTDENNQVRYQSKFVKE